MIDYIEDILSEYNPWWNDGTSILNDLPSFTRPVFQEIIDDIDSLPQILSVTGPRRIGKSTILKQAIRHLISKGISPKKITYYSFDDPALFRGKEGGANVIEELMNESHRTKDNGITYLFLDEIQRLPHWELYLKKYYDLKFPVRIVISGSASSPIFKQSRESLLGRVKEYHLMPFSFREYVLHELHRQEKTVLYSEVSHCYKQGNNLGLLIHRAPGFENPEPMLLTLPSSELQFELDGLLKHYMLNGGFPETWSMLSWQQKSDYLFQNQIEKVIYEDLLIATEFKKPELLKRFYISLLDKPGAEVTITGMASQTEIRAEQITKYLPLLELTNLVFTLRKFRNSSVGFNKGKMKVYLADLALRNSVLRLGDTLLHDEQMLGYYAENLVFLALKKWKGSIHLDYYRDDRHEIDFIVEVSPKQYLPLEVKYRNTITEADFRSLSWFVKNKESIPPILVTKNWDQWGNTAFSTFSIPLPYFLLLVD